MPSRLFSDYKTIWWNKDNSLDTLYNYIKDYKFSIDGYGNITITNSDKKSLPVFCCHLDTVHSDKPYPKLVREDVLISMNDHGIGGDDKCGIVACLELLKKVECKVIFFRDEEIGCLGAKVYNQNTLKKDQFMVEIDRKGSGDLIFNSSFMNEMASEEFMKDAEKIGDDFGYKAANGLYTDVSQLSDCGISRMNISAGYYLPHTNKEYVILSELDNAINFCVRLALFLTKQYKHKVVEREVKATELFFGDYGSKAQG